MCVSFNVFVYVWLYVLMFTRMYMCMSINVRV